MSLLTNDTNFKALTLDVVIEKKNTIYIKKFRFFLSIAEYINLYLIFFDIYINNAIIMLDVEFNL